MALAINEGKEFTTTTTTVGEEEATKKRRSDTEYLKEHGVAALLNDLVSRMLIERPDVSIDFIVEWANQRRGNQPSASGESSAPFQLEDGGSSPEKTLCVPRPMGGDRRLSSESTASSLRRRSSLSAAKSWARHMIAHEFAHYSTRIRYDDGLNDVRLNVIPESYHSVLVRGKSAARHHFSHSVVEPDSTGSFSEFMEAVRQLCIENNLPLPVIEADLLSFLSRIDPNSWLSDVQKIESSAIFLFTLETFVFGNGAQSIVGKDYETTVTPPQASRAPQWLFADTYSASSGNVTMQPCVSAGIEELYRSATRLQALRPLCIAMRGANEPTATLSDSLCSDSPSVKSDSSLPLPHVGSATSQELANALSIWGEAESAVASRNADRARWCIRNMWTAIEEYRCMNSDVRQVLPQGADVAASVPFSLFCPNTGSSTSTREERSQALQSYLAAQSPDDVLAGLETLMAMEVVPHEEADYDSANDGSPIQQKPSGERRGTAVYLEAPQLDAPLLAIINEKRMCISIAGLPWKELIRIAFADRNSIRTVLQRCARTGQYSRAEKIVAAALSDAVKYQIEESPHRSVVIVPAYKALFAHFVASRCFSEGSLVTFVAPTLATASEDLLHGMLEVHLPKDTEAPPPVVFCFNCTTAVRVSEFSMYPRAAEVIFPAFATFLVEQDGTSGEGTIVVANQVDRDSALHLQLKRLLRKAPNPQCADFVWQILSGSRIIRVPAAAPNARAPTEWVVCLDGVDIHLGDLVELYQLNVKGSLEEFAKCADAVRAAGQERERAMKDEKAPKDVGLGDHYVFAGEHSNLSINLDTYVGEFREHSGARRSVRVRAQPSFRIAAFDDNDVAYLCSVLALNPGVEHVFIEGNPEISDESAEQLVALLGSNSTLTKISVKECGMSDCAMSAIAVLGCCERHDDIVRFPPPDCTALTLGGANIETEEDAQCSLSYALSLLPRTSPLHSLCVSGNSSSRIRPISHLFLHVAQWRSITELHMESVSVGGASADDKSDSGSGSGSPWSVLLCLASQLQRLSLSNFDPCDTATFRILAALVRGGVLTELHMEFVEVCFDSLLHLTAALPTDLSSSNSLISPLVEPHSSSSVDPASQKKTALRTLTFCEFYLTDPPSQSSPKGQDADSRELPPPQQSEQQPDGGGGFEGLTLCLNESLNASLGSMNSQSKLLSAEWRQIYSFFLSNKTLKTVLWENSDFPPIVQSLIQANCLLRNQLQSNEISRQEYEVHLQGMIAAVPTIELPSPDL